MSSPSVLPWETVTVFISSTFNDMHAERDYLVKRVFPELREWCEQRNLRLVDIDLRWGVTEADATNRNTVKVCLTQIDKARPFFLCFLGQRRGWVPSRNEIDPETCKLFPDLKKYAGIASVTEMEILHAVVNPLNDNARAEHAFFYHRDPSYLKDLPTDSRFLKDTYTNEGIEDAEARSKADVDLRFWLEETIPQTRRPLHHYSATWSHGQRTPELALPLQCPSSLPENQGRWREQWRKAGIEPCSLDLTENLETERQAQAFNEQVTAGRLTDFTCDGEDLAVIIRQDLEEAIAARYPDHMVLRDQAPLQKELNQQAQFLELNSSGFIERTGDFDALDQYIASDSHDLYILTAPAGMGKTMLLANWIKRVQDRHSEKSSVFYRFIGASDGSMTVDSVIRSLLSEIKNAGLLPSKIPVDPRELRDNFGNLLISIDKRYSVILVIDALNQLESGFADLKWLPRKLPDGVKLVVSFKRGEADAEELARHFREVMPKTYADVTPFKSLEDRKKLVGNYLGQYLKQLDDVHIQALITSPGAENPLFLKIVLSELRVFGSFVNLGQKIKKDFGTTPVEAFDAVLRRLETDPAFTAIPLRDAVPLLFGLLSHARVGLSEQELAGLLSQERSGLSDDARWETIRLILRQVRPFIAIREGRFDFFYDSFRLAVLARYEGNEPQRGQRNAASWHRSLAAYFERLPVWVSRDKRQPTLRQTVQLPYHLAWAGMADHLAELLLNTDLLEAVVYGLGVREAIRDIKYARAPPIPLSKELSQDLMTALPVLEGALRLSQHILGPHPEELPSQLHGRLIGCGNPVIERMLEGLRTRTRRPWLRPVTATLTAPGGPLLRTLAGHTSWVTAVAVTPDGRSVVSGSNETLKIWDLASGQELVTLKGQCGGVDDLIVTPDGRFVVSTSSWNSYRYYLQIWDLERGNKQYTLSGHSDGICTVAVTPDGKKVVSGSQDCTVKVWDLASGKELVTLKGHTGAIITVAVTPDGKKVVSGSQDCTLKVWDLLRGTELLTLAGHADWITAVTVTPSGMTAVSGSRDCTLKVWDLLMGRELHTLVGHTNAITSVTLVPDRGSAVVSGSADQTLKVWDIVNGSELLTLAGHNDKITAVAVTSDGRRAISRSRGRILKVWDLMNGSELVTLAGHADVITAMAVTADGRRIISGSRDQTLKIWDLDGSREPHPSASHARRVSSMAVTSDGRRAVSGSWDQTLKVWDIESGRELHTLFGHTAAITAVAVTPDCRRAISGSYDTTVKVWNLESGRELRTLAGHTDKIKAVAVSPDGRKIVSGSKFNTLKIWDLEWGNALATLKGSKRELSNVEAVAMSLDGRTFVSGSADRTLKVWDLMNGKELHTFTGHTGGITAVAVTLDCRRAVSGSSDRTLKVWDLESGQELHTLVGHADVITAVAVSHDGRKIVSVSRDHTLKVWDIESGSLVTGITVDGGLTAVALSDIMNTLIAGDEGGNLHCLVFENNIPDPYIVTAQRDSSGSPLKCRCPYCGTEAPVREYELRTVVTCPSCDHDLRLNQFAIVLKYEPTIQTAKRETMVSMDNTIHTTTDIEDARRMPSPDNSTKGIQRLFRFFGGRKS